MTCADDTRGSATSLRPTTYQLRPDLRPDKRQVLLEQRAHFEREAVVLDPSGDRRISGQEACVQLVRVAWHFDGDRGNRLGWRRAAAEGAAAFDDRSAEVLGAGAEDIERGGE